MRKPMFSVLMPVYKGANVIKESVKSILKQTFTDFELLIQDNNSNDNVEDILKSFKDKRIKFFQNNKNLGYPKNLEKLKSRARGTYIYLLAHDDILSTKALELTYTAYLSGKDIGAVTRPYYWFNSYYNIPVRAKKQLNSKSNTTLSMKSDYISLMEVFSSIDQLSGLSMRRSLIKKPFHQDIFSCHAYPFASILKEHKIVFLKNYVVAVRISSSMTRYDPTIYKKSPLLSDVDFFYNVFPESKFDTFRNYMIKNFVGKEYVSLVQLKTYSTFRILLREIVVLIKCNPLNVINPIFWIFVFGTIIIPGPILRMMADNFKNLILSKNLKKIRLA